MFRIVMGVCSDGRMDRIMHCAHHATRTSLSLTNGVLPVPSSPTDNSCMADSRICVTTDPGIHTIRNSCLGYGIISHIHRITSNSGPIHCKITNIHRDRTNHSIRGCASKSAKGSCKNPQNAGTSSSQPRRTAVHALSRLARPEASIKVCSHASFNRVASWKVTRRISSCGRSAHIQSSSRFGESGVKRRLSRSAVVKGNTVGDFVARGSFE